MVSSRQGALVCVLFASACIGCSADANANPAYGHACASGTAYKGFCLDAGEQHGQGLAPHADASDATITSRNDAANVGATPVASQDAAVKDAASSADPAKGGTAAQAARTNQRDASTSATPTPADVSGAQCSQVAATQRESCNDLDDDCDGRVDEDADVPCADGNAGCNQASDGTFLCKGICRASVKHCLHGVLETACSGQVLPGAQELCDATSAVDDDCDGATDEMCVCSPGDTQDCYSGPADTRDVGTCKHGTQACAGETFGACVNEIGPVEETCMNDGSDDDCNKVDDDVPMRGSACTTAAPGRCRSGTLQCDSGELRCRTPNPIAETCNMLDDDCDGMVDEGFLQTDANNCGMCGHRCAAAQACCAGRCVDMHGDGANCGACAHACGAKELCCDGDCVSNISDDHCGSCTNSCSSLQTCCPSGMCGILDALGICL